MRVLYLNFLVSCFILSLFKPLCAQESLRVFLIHSRAVSSASSEAIESSLISSIMAEGYEVTIFSESIHYGLDNLVGQEGVVESIIRNRVDRFQPDIVVVNGLRATEKYATFRSEIFNSLPVLFCAIPEVSEKVKKRFPNAVYAVDKFPLEDVFELVLGLHPNVDRIIFTGTSDKLQNKYRFEDVYKLAELNKDRVEVVCYFDVPVDRIYEDLITSKTEDVMIELERLVDDRGHNVLADVFFNQLHQQRKVPLYSFWKTTRNYGILGGKFFVENKKGENAAHLLVKLYEEDNFSGVFVLDSSQYSFFYNELKTYGIDRKDIPHSSVVFNDPHRLSPEHKKILLYIIIAAICALILIVLLLWSNYKRKLSERKVRVFNNDLEQKNEQLLNLFQERKDYISIVSHDLKTPLAAISSTSHLMVDICSEIPDVYSDEMLTYTDFIQKASSEMLLRIDSILNTEQSEGFQNRVDFKPVIIPEFVEEVLSPLRINAESKGILIHSKSSGFDLKAFTDLSLMRDIINNLVSNSIKYSWTGSPIHIETRLKKAEKMWVLRITDEGEGFSEEDKRHLFERFKRLSSQPTANESSSGLGLYIVNQNVSLLQGRIELTSSKGKGSTFSLEFPLEPSSVETDTDWASL